MNLPRLLFWVGGLALLVSVGNARAIVVRIDPGNVGNPFSGTTVDLPGTMAENVRVLFDDMKHIELDPQRAVFTQLAWGPPFGFNFSATMEYGFLDEMGNTILSSGVFTGTIATTSHPRNLIVTEPLIAHGLFFNVSSVGPLAAPPAAGAPRVEFQVDARVGEWTVAEPTTVLLLGLGLAGLGFARRQLH